MPPVGIKWTFAYGALRSFNFLAPPLDSAGKNFNCVNPIERAISTSLAVDTPGYTSTSWSKHHWTTFVLNPGVIINLAPASTASFACSTDNTVPAPTNISGNCSEIVWIALVACSLRYVTSITSIPPFSSALANGYASSFSRILTTGTIPVLEIRFIYDSIVPPSIFYTLRVSSTRLLFSKPVHL